MIGSLFDDQEHVMVLGNMEDLLSNFGMGFCCGKVDKDCEWMHKLSGKIWEFSLVYFEDRFVILNLSGAGFLGVVLILKGIKIDWFSHGNVAVVKML
ncbi:hypothetical protein L1049_005744 [Liquidambar formosana]|uniref:Uncharacterized protein n=1 Tax=Liquidambar formosana TaxID=63359 RepID=A0AAP0RF48_LIQFO